MNSFVLTLGELLLTRRAVQSYLTPSIITQRSYRGASLLRNCTIAVFFFGKLKFLAKGHD